MAKQEGIMPISGTIGGINFYYRKGKPFARTAGGGFNGDAIANGPSMVRVRENMSEFGRCSKITAAMRHSLHPFLGNHRDGTLHGRLMKMLQQVKTYDNISVRGERRVGIGLEDPMGWKLFSGFSFAPKYSFAAIVGGNAYYDAGASSLTVSDFDIGRVAFPAAATHMEIKFGVLRFDFETADCLLYQSVPLVMTRSFDGDGFSLTLPVSPEGEGMRIGFGCVRFYQEVGGNLYVLKDEGSIGVGVL